MNPNTPRSTAPENRPSTLSRRTVMQAAWAVPVVVAAIAAPAAAATVPTTSSSSVAVVGASFFIQKGGGSIKTVTLTVPFSLASLPADPTLTIVSIHFTFTIPPTISAAYTLTGSSPGWTSTAVGHEVTAIFTGTLSQLGTTTLKVNTTTGNSNSDAIVGQYYAIDSHGQQTAVVPFSVVSS